MWSMGTSNQLPSFERQLGRVVRVKSMGEVFLWAHKQVLQRQMRKSLYLLPLEPQRANLQALLQKQETQSSWGYFSCQI